MPIPGTPKPERLNENLGTVHVAFTPEELTEIGSACANIKVQGDRYSESSARLIDR